MKGLRERLEAWIAEDQHGVVRPPFSIYLNDARSLAAALARLEWQPISTAPKDGTFILLAGPSGYKTTPLRVEVGRYYPEYRPHNPWQTHSNDAFTDGGDPPTHWMPLPPAPTLNPDPTPRGEERGMSAPVDSSGLAVSLMAETIERLRAELEAERERGDGLEWQPIEMAPKDGAEMLVVEVDGAFYIATQHGRGWYDTSDGRKVRPTHWRPLPAAPAPAGERSEG